MLAVFVWSRIVFDYLILFQSVLGGFLDPLADKIMVTTVALALGQEGIIPAALVVSEDM